MTHWADKYVGLPAEGARPCWALVRRIWIERLGFEMPRFDEEDDPEKAIALGARKFIEVARGQEREMDAVMMMVPTRSPAGVRTVEKHMGVVVAKGLVLHVEEGRTSIIEDLRDLHVSRILRGPWVGGAA